MLQTETQAKGRKKFLATEDACKAGDKAKAHRGAFPCALFTGYIVSQSNVTF